MLTRNPKQTSKWIGAHVVVFGKCDLRCKCDTCKQVNATVLAELTPGRFSAFCSNCAADKQLDVVAVAAFNGGSANV